LEEGIEQSCNPYFWALYRDLLQQDGYSDDNAEFKQHYQIWRDHIMSFGLGNKFTDTDISEQAKGAIPSVGLYDKIYGKKGWKAITIRSLSIGQGEILVTPLQLANQTAAIANKTTTAELNHRTILRFMFPPFVNWLIIYQLSIS
jgi:penicillin-binding protein 2